jgi:CDP-diacylglycerol--glycerol-3-phosphate 3-phosphatidyltransferase
MNSDKTSYYIINGITMYRLVSAPFLLLMAATGHSDIFKWLIAFSFFTDAIDGPLSRKYKVTSVSGSRLDSVADDATVFVATIGLWIIHPEFVREEWMILTGLLSLLIVQTIAALIAYRKVTSFHTYLAKTAAVAQAAFFFVIFFDVGPAKLAFYVAAGITALELLEEIVLVISLRRWKANVKGLYWVLRERRMQSSAN